MSKTKQERIDDALEEYEKKRKPLREEYDKKCEPFLEEYEKKRKPFWEEFEKKCAEIDAEEEEAEDNE